MGVRLKPCPFCGSTDIYETHSEEDTLGTKNPEIFCNSCKTIFSIEDDSPYTDYDEDYAYRKAKTVEAWNMRPLQEMDIVRCGECKYAKYRIENIEYDKCMITQLFVNKNDFCSYGEPRESEYVAKGK